MRVLCKSEDRQIGYCAIGVARSRTGGLKWLLKRPDRARYVLTVNNQHSKNSPVAHRGHELSFLVGLHAQQD